MSTTASMSAWTTSSLRTTISLLSSNVESRCSSTSARTTGSATGCVDTRAPCLPVYHLTSLLQVGNEQMTLNLEWTGQGAFAAKPLRDWKVGDRAVGVTRSSGPLTFATIQGAGHMVRLIVLRCGVALSSLCLPGAVRQGRGVSGASQAVAGRRGTLKPASRKSLFWLFCPWSPQIIPCTIGNVTTACPSSTKFGRLSMSCIMGMCYEVYTVHHRTPPWNPRRAVLCEGYG